ncbi:MAG: hypothetical protein ACTHLO_11625 [Pseudolabrys sp.]
MKILYAGVVAMLAGAAEAHDSFMPHSHPHGVSFLPSVETVGVAALVLSLAVIAYTKLRRG